MNQPKIIIGVEYDGFTIAVGEKRFRFDQEDPVGEEMIRLFQHLGFENVTTEEWY
jgi:hypothetical protein